MGGICPHHCPQHVVLALFFLPGPFYSFFVTCLTHVGICVCHAWYRRSPRALRLTFWDLNLWWAAGRSNFSSSKTEGLVNEISKATASGKEKSLFRLTGLDNTSVGIGVSGHQKALTDLTPCKLVVPETALGAQPDWKTPRPSWERAVSCSLSSSTQWVLRKWCPEWLQLWPCRPGLLLTYHRTLGKLLLCTTPSPFLHEEDTSSAHEWTDAANSFVEHQSTQCKK